MSPWRALLCIILPPLAVLDKGIGMALLVGILWITGGLPGIIAAFVINLLDIRLRPAQQSNHIPTKPDLEFDAEFEKPKRKGAYVRLADGEIAEVIEDDGAMPDMRKLYDE